MSQSNPLIDVAAAISDGTPVDWSLFESRSASAADRLVRQLRVLERIASVHSSPALNIVDRTVSGPATPAVEQKPGGRGHGRWGSLTLVELIGSGTHADVYLARDPRLDRPVALKLLKQRELQDRDAADEIIHEARLLARARHANVVTVYGAERLDGRAGIWTEFVDGPTLEEELRDRGPLPVADLIAVAVALCGALEAVHGAGVLHRDIKAQNVLHARDGRILLADFGTSREASRSTGAELAGTPMYLAPEVLCGEAASAASDVYSLGVLLYYLATGAFPVEARSLADLRGAHDGGVRVPLVRRRPDLPRRLTAIIERAADPTPERRYESAAALRAALAAVSPESRLLPMVAAGALAALVAALVVPLTRAPGVGTPTQVVLVGAFDNQTGQAQLDEIIQLAFQQELLQSRGLTVAPAERIDDALRLMRRPPSTPLDEAAALEVSRRDGGIQAFTTGRVDRLGNRYMLHVVASRATTGAAIVRASAEADDLDALLRGVRQVAGRIRTALGESPVQVNQDARLEPVTTSSLEALRHYTAAMTLANDHRWAAAELRLSEAVGLDPGFASALIFLAYARKNMGRPESEYLPPAEDAFRLAEALPARERYFITGSYSQLSEDLPRAIAAYESLVREHPNDFWGLNNLSIAYNSSGRYREEIPIVKRLARLRPNDFAYLLETAMELIVVGDGFHDARAIIEQASRLEVPAGHPSDIYAAWLALFPVFEAWADGRVETAAAKLEALEATPPRDDWEAFGRGQLNLSLGRVAAAERAFQAVSVPAERTAFLAYAALARGDTRRARAALARVAPELANADVVTGQGRFGRATVICWALVQVGMSDGCRQLATLFPPVRVAPWFTAEAAGAEGDDAVAVPILEDLDEGTPPGNPQTVMVMDTLATIHERRGDLDAAAATLARSDGARVAVYPNSGSRGFFWLRAQAHLMRIEQRRGHVERAAAIQRQLDRFLAVADDDFVLGPLVP